jgi:uncharacterized membrane protein AbrB (regulator of aidB expression)
LPGTTAIWGSSPGAATAMTLMSESYGADMRLVAVMQYLRVVLVVLTASLVARLLLGAQGASSAATVPSLEASSTTTTSRSSYSCARQLSTQRRTMRSRLYVVTTTVKNGVAIPAEV